MSFLDFEMLVMGMERFNTHVLAYKVLRMGKMVGSSSGRFETSH